MNPQNAAPPRENLTRAIAPGRLELREESDGAMPTLVSRFSVFNRWTEIDSWFEGRFMERIAPGAFKKTMRENRSQIKPLFQHGQDPQIGSKVLGPISDLREERDEAVGEVPLFDTSYNRDLVPGLKAGVYGSSFRFNVVKEEVNQKPERSESNPDGLPERTIKEVRLFEFGPVTFPAYADATAGVRSLTDEMLLGRLMDDPDKLQELLARATKVGISIPRDLNENVRDNLRELADDADEQTEAETPEEVVETTTDDEVSETPDEDVSDETENDDDALKAEEPDVVATPGDEDESTPEPSRSFDFWFAGAGDEPTPQQWKRRRERLFRLT